MTPPACAGLLVVRPEPGNARTLAALRADGVDAIGWPLFAVAPVAWEAPEPADFDSLLVTSANAMRHAGPGLQRLAALPVIAVGTATAAAARAAGLTVAATGTGDAATALGMARGAGLRRPLHLAGADHGDSGHPTVVVYDSAVLPVDAAAFAAAARGRIVLLHSVRAARRVATLVAGRTDVGVAALSPAVLDAAGPGWGFAAAPATPEDAALRALALAAADARAIDPAPGGGDKGP